jgi:uridine monophosphate synthetase
MNEPHHSRTLSYQARAVLPTTSPLSAYLLNLMTIKRSNLCLSADVTTSAELLQLAEELGDYISVLKTHADIIDDFSGRTVHLLKGIAARKHFLVFEDRKFADIGIPLFNLSSEANANHHRIHCTKAIYFRQFEYSEMG